MGRNLFVKLKHCQSFISRFFSHVDKKKVHVKPEFQLHIVIGVAMSLSRGVTVDCILVSIGSVEVSIQWLLVLLSSFTVAQRTIDVDC